MGLVEDSRSHPCIAVYICLSTWARHTVTSLFQFCHNIGPGPGYLHQLALRRRGCRRSLLEIVQGESPIPLGNWAIPPIPPCLSQEFEQTNHNQPSLLTVSPSDPAEQISNWLEIVET